MNYKIRNRKPTLVMNLPPMIAEPWKIPVIIDCFIIDSCGAVGWLSRKEKKADREKKVMMNYTYIVKCSDDSYYTGWTNNLQKRVDDHNAGKGAKYTKSRRPVELIYYETFETKEEAMSREYAIKQLSRPEKEKLFLQID